MQVVRNALAHTTTDYPLFLVPLVKMLTGNYWDTEMSSTVLSVKYQPNLTGMIIVWSSIKLAKMTLTQLRTRSPGQIMFKPVNTIIYYTILSISTKLHGNDHWMIFYQNR